MFRFTDEKKRVKLVGVPTGFVVVDLSGGFWWPHTNTMGSEVTSLVHLLHMQLEHSNFYLHNEHAC